jgi:hypothetical protein
LQMADFWLTFRGRNLIDVSTALHST